jgi:hypothetical protein
MTKCHLITGLAILAVALSFDGWTFAGAPWNVLVSTTTPASNDFFSVATFYTSVGFVKIEAPNGATVSAGNVVTITVTSAPPNVVMSNGVGYGTLTLSSNDWCNFCCRTGTNTIEWRLTITHQ